MRPTRSLGGTPQLPNLHAFIVASLRHRHLPAGPILLRDPLGTTAERDPEVYATTTRAKPGRVLAVYLREVRLDPGDGRVEKV